LLILICSIYISICFFTFQELEYEVESKRLAKYAGQSKYIKLLISDTKSYQIGFKTFQLTIINGDVKSLSYIWKSNNKQTSKVFDLKFVYFRHTANVHFCATSISYWKIIIIHVDRVYQSWDLSQWPVEVQLVWALKRLKEESKYISLDYFYFHLCFRPVQTKWVRCRDAMNQIYVNTHTCIHNCSSL